MDYLRIDPRMDEHPDIEDAGFAGARVFEAVLRAVARNDGQGRLRGKFAHPGWLARRMNLTREAIGGIDPETWVNHGLESCVRCGLLLREEMDYVIPGWEKFYAPRKTNAERQAEYRKQQEQQREEAVVSAIEPDAEALQRVTAVTTRATSNATPLHTTPLHKTEAREEPAPTLASQIPDVLSVYAYYRDKFQRRQLEPSVAQRDSILCAIREGYSPGELKQAIDGLSNSDWHRKKGFLGVEHALKDRETIDRCIKWAVHPPDKSDTPTSAARVFATGTDGHPCVDCNEAAECQSWDEWICYPCLAKREKRVDRTGAQHAG